MTARVATKAFESENESEMQQRLTTFLPFYVLVFLPLYILSFLSIFFVKAKIAVQQQLSLQWVHPSPLYQ